MTKIKAGVFRGNCDSFIGHLLRIWTPEANPVRLQARTSLIRFACSCGGDRVSNSAWDLAVPERLVSCPVNSLYFRACIKRCSEARSAGNTGCISKGRNAATALYAGSRRACQPRPLAALRLLTRATAIACKARLARNLGWHAEMRRINRTGH